ncbi:MAG: ribose-phosphate pyrophosphokinase-like domain-containing protein [Candidatus Bathyarchaeota archaeon]|jgi:hypothetical protein
MILVQGSGTKQIGDFIAKELNAELVSVKSRTFPDGEIQLCISGDIRNGDVILLHSTGPPRALGIEATISDIEETDPKSAVDYDAILIGSPNHFGGPVRGIMKFIDKLGKPD